MPHGSRRLNGDIVAVVPGEAEPLRLTLQRWMELYKIPGSERRGVRPARSWCGPRRTASRRRDSPIVVTLDTLFQAGSISKPVTAMAALHFVEAGRWSPRRSDQRPARVVEAACQRPPEGSAGHAPTAVEPQRGHHGPWVPRLRSRCAGANGRAGAQRRAAGQHRAGPRGSRARIEGALQRWRHDHRAADDGRSAEEALSRDHGRDGAASRSG